MTIKNKLLFGLTDLILGLALGFSAAGVIDIYVLTPKPVKTMLAVVKDTPGINQSLGDVGKIKIVRNSFMQTQWEGSITNNMATVNCKIWTQQGEGLLAGRLIYVGKEWRPLYISFYKDHKDLVIFNAIQHPKP